MELNARTRCAPGRYFGSAMPVVSLRACAAIGPSPTMPIFVGSAAAPLLDEKPTPTISKPPQTTARPARIRATNRRRGIAESLFIGVHSMERWVTSIGVRRERFNSRSIETVRSPVRLLVDRVDPVHGLGLLGARD